MLEKRNVDGFRVHINEQQRSLESIRRHITLKRVTTEWHDNLSHLVIMPFKTMRATHKTVTYVGQGCRVRIDDRGTIMIDMVRWRSDSPMKDIIKGSDLLKGVFIHTSDMNTGELTFESWMGLHPSSFHQKGLNGYPSHEAWKYGW